MPFSLPALLFLAGGYFAVSLRFFPLLHPIRTSRLFFKKSDGGEGESPLRAAGAAMAGTIGVGNVAGVAYALYDGGAGAVFWMWVSSFFAAYLKYAEITLSQDARQTDVRGFSAGGTPYAMQKNGWKRGGVLFALLCVAHGVLVGGMVQANALAESLSSGFSLPPPLCGYLLFFVTWLLIRKKKSTVFSVSAWLVPLMCGLYLFLCLCVICHFSSRIGDAFSAIWQGGGIWQASDLLLHAMTAVNLLFLFSCRRRVRALTKEAGLLPP